MVTIRHKTSGEVLYEDEAESLAGADLSRMELEGADLRGMHLRGANLQGANLAGADLRETDVKGSTSASTWRPISHSRVKSTGTRSARRPMSNANFVITLSAAFSPTVSPAPAAPRAATIS